MAQFGDRSSEKHPFAARRKLAGSLVALGSAAVVSVYTIGYISTQSSLDDLTAQVDITALSPTTMPSPPGTSVGTSVDVPRTASATPGATPVAAVPEFADGTFNGTGDSRHGSITVAVAIKDGEIVSASVTDCATRYPCSDVNPLISAVLTNQEVPGNHVSGATDSSIAYKSAVTKALQQALNGGDV